MANYYTNPKVTQIRTFIAQVLLHHDKPVKMFAAPSTVKEAYAYITSILLRLRVAKPIVVNNLFLDDTVEPYQLEVLIENEQQ